MYSSTKRMHPLSSKPKYYFYFLAFIEGGCVMACELLAAKIIAPFLGSSLYIWASLLGMSLAALTLGYYRGGLLSRRNHRPYTAAVYLIIASLSIAIMPKIAQYLLTWVIDWDIVWAALASLVIFLFAPLFLMGMSTPAIIQTINTIADTSGKIAGRVYGISTLGGIFACFFIGFYAMPHWGITKLCLIMGLTLFAVSSVLLLYYKCYKQVGLILIVFLVNIFFTKEKYTTDGNSELVYESEGIFGQIRVIDAPIQTYYRGTQMGRTLFVNNIGQSTALRDNLQYDCWDYSYFFPTVVSMFPKGSKALLMGLGGGTIVHQYQRVGLDIEVVEIDERIKQTAIDYFGVNPNTKITIDDARHYINTCHKKYDVITFDMFLNETPPAQVLTLETFLKVKKMLNPKGLWVLNYFGYTSGNLGKSARSIYKTLKAAGFEVEIMTTPSESEGERNIIFLASHQKFDFGKVDYEEPALPKITDIRKYFLDLKSIDTNDAEILCDEYPRFDYLYLQPSIDWRKRAIEYQVKPMIDANIKLIK